MSHPEDEKAYLELDEALHAVRSNLINELEAIRAIAASHLDPEVADRLERLIDLFKRSPL